MLQNTLYQPIFYHFPTIPRVETSLKNKKAGISNSIETPAFLELVDGIEPPTC
jgi:hypothetical protein